MPVSKPKARIISPDRDLTKLGPSEATAFLAEHTFVDVQEGVLRAFEYRYLLSRPEILVNIQKQLEQTVGISTKGFLYLAGERSGKDELHAIQDLVPEAPDRDPSILKQVINAVALLGWGRFEATLVDPESKRFVVALRNSPIANAYGPSKKPVCHLVAGWLAGIAHNMFGKDFLCEETACAAQGAARCEFQMRPMPFA